MKVYDILEEAKLGKEEFKNKKHREQIVESYDDGDEKYKFSKVISQTTTKLMESKNGINESVFQNILRCKEKIELLEEKDEITKPYAGLKFSSLKDNLKSIEESLTNKKIMMSLNESLLIYDLALIKMKADELAESAEAAQFKFKNDDLRRKVEKEIDFIKTIL